MSSNNINQTLETLDQSQIALNQGNLYSYAIKKTSKSLVQAQTCPVQRALETANKDLNTRNTALQKSEANLKAQIESLKRANQDLESKNRSLNEANLEWEARNRQILEDRNVFLASYKAMGKAHKAEIEEKDKVISSLYEQVKRLEKAQGPDNQTSGALNQGLFKVPNFLHLQAHKAQNGHASPDYKAQIESLKAQHEKEEAELKREVSELKKSLEVSGKVMNSLLENTVEMKKSKASLEDELVKLKLAENRYKQQCEESDTKDQIISKMTDELYMKEEHIKGLIRRSIFA